MAHQVAVIVGSLSQTSINAQLARALGPLAAAAGLELVEVPIDGLPLFDPDLEGGIPAAVAAFKASLEAADAVLIVTPEYNRSIPGALKNALDWASRPWGKNSLAGKPAAILGASPSPLGTALAQRHLRDVLGFLDTRLLQQPEVYVQWTPGYVDAGGQVADPSNAAFLGGFLQAFAARIAG